MQIEQIPISKLVPHPDNPRLFMREEVVNAICEQIKANGGVYEERHAPHVRHLENGTYQIISGHQRTDGAKLAGVKKVPCIVVEMTDEEAFRELLLSNAQSDLKPLEIGLHVLKAVGPGKGGRGKKGGIAEYAAQLGKSKQIVDRWVCAARVAKSSTWVDGLLDYTESLAMIHRDPNESDWADLVERMLAGGWNKEQTERYVESVKALEVPEDLAEIFPRPVIIARFFEKREFSQATLEAIIKLIRGTEAIIRSFAEVADVEPIIEGFRLWLQESAERALDARQILRQQKLLVQDLETAEVETEQRWSHGDWRDLVSTLADNSVALVLTDPPYGIEYKSNRAVARKGHRKIENDGSDEAVAEIQECLAALEPKLKADAHILCFCHWRNEEQIRSAIIAGGYGIRGSLIWVKDQQGAGDLTGAFAPKHERIIHAVKGSPALWRREPDVLEAARVMVKEIHPSEKPVPLLRRLIEATTIEGELVVDPFGGVASSLVAAKQSKRLFWGCEIDAEYFREGAARLDGAGR